MLTLTHPAVAVAVDALAGADEDLTPVAAVERDDVVAVLVYGERSRTVVFVRDIDGVWTPPGIVIGSGRPNRARNEFTLAEQPIQRLTRKSHARPLPDGSPEPIGWCAVTGIAARDAVGVAVSSSLEQQAATIEEDGLVFVVLRALTDETPQVVVHLADGRAIEARGVS
ncbi:hypothetical protein [Nocardia callitridis]|uniref:Uncharacterized protein n=1 Tax=Nocardia callitridis TaxID=648753 RepID=A0ABP9K288_9NOCA